MTEAELRCYESIPMLAKQVRDIANEQVEIQAQLRAINENLRELTETMKKIWL